MTMCVKLEVTLSFINVKVSLDTCNFYYNSNYSGITTNY